MLYGHLQVSNHFTKPFGQLHVIVTCFNPMRYVTRYTLFREFVKSIQATSAIVWVVEIAFGGRPFEVTEVGNPQHIQLRSDQELWLKENMINAAIARLPLDWEYVAWIDGDIIFVNPHWVQETIHQLQHYCAVQMFHTAIDLNPDGTPAATFVGFPASIAQGNIPHKHGYYYYEKKGLFHPGYAWAYRKEAWNTIGGLLDINIVGGGDHQMAHAFYGQIDKAIPFKCTKGYKEWLKSWEKEALKLNQNIGFVPGTIMHNWHGRKINRRYFDRWKILSDNNFDPHYDLHRDWHGLWQLSRNKPKLRNDMMQYFRRRQEDGIDL